ncbi:uncharacterized protein LOC130434817 isoform X2 [Triplophysa dalaica]|uniref:uncharacterized protein LOC130434817 isoform X2 n=1 Tax=Triplophysa dalaica TaxID=1582913 RepID=UPI0024E028CD|nr:uncharacterized protein LOC130434817 isoform X2 [Triplophysa dalaica]
MMNWHHELSSILSETDGSVAKMRERLSAHARSPRATEDVYPVREVPADRDLKVSSSVSPAVHWSDLKEVQNHLHQQSQAIDTLTQSVRLLERERNAQQTLIQTLQDELRRLQVRLEERERGGAYRSRQMSGAVEERRGSRVEQFERSHQQSQHYRNPGGKFQL